MTLFDIMENVYNKKTGYLDHTATDFHKDIWPVLAGTYRLAWVNAKAFQGHGTFRALPSACMDAHPSPGPGGYGDYLSMENDLSDNEGDAAQRQHIFKRLREPNFRNEDQAHVILMPRLSGDNGAVS